MILAELERANNRVAATERRNVSTLSVMWRTRSLIPSLLQELLRAEMEAVRSGSDVQNRLFSLFTSLTTYTDDSITFKGLLLSNNRFLSLPTSPSVWLGY